MFECGNEISSATFSCFIQLFVLRWGRHGYNRHHICEEDFLLNEFISCEVNFVSRTSVQKIPSVTGSRLAKVYPGTPQADPRSLTFPFLQLSFLSPRRCFLQIYFPVQLRQLEIFLKLHLQNHWLNKNVKIFSVVVGTRETSYSLHYARTFAIIQRDF